MKKLFLNLFLLVISSTVLYAQTYQPLENQRLSTTNNVRFKQVIVDGVAWPGNSLEVTSGNIWLGGYTYVNDDLSTHGFVNVENEFYHQKNISVVNKAINGWIPWAIRNTTGTESVIDLTNIGSVVINKSVAIGTTSPGTYKLAVEGKIGAREIKVTLESPWADYVFKKDYNLMSIYNLEKYILLNNHLPNIPSAEEVKKNDGVDLGAMNIKILEKVEELTLYIIQLKKENDALREDNEAIKKKLEELSGK